MFLVQKESNDTKDSIKCPFPLYHRHALEMLQQAHVQHPNSAIAKPVPRTKIKTVLFLLFASLAGCANPGVIHMSGDTYLLSKSSAAGAFTNLPKLKAEVINEAQVFARSRGKVAVEVSLHDTFPAHGFPSVDYQFRLEDAPPAKEHP